MELKKPAMAGTLESSDAQVFVEPGNEGVVIDIDSVVFHQYGRRIRQVVEETLERLGVTDINLRIIDKGALDCTLKARVECAVYRSADQVENIPWGGAVS